MEMFRIMLGRKGFKAKRAILLLLLKTACTLMSLFFACEYWIHEKHHSQWPPLRQWESYREDRPFLADSLWHFEHSSWEEQWLAESLLSQHYAVVYVLPVLNYPWRFVWGRKIRSMRKLQFQFLENVEQNPSEMCDMESTMICVSWKRSGGVCQNAPVM